MIKTAFAASAAVLAFAAPGAALVGPYVNIEANSGFTGSDYTGTTTDAHVETRWWLVPCPMVFKQVLPSS